MQLIDQKAEITALESALEDCRAGRNRIVLIEGAAGCGKSELLATFAEQAASTGANVLFAAGSAADRDAPLGTLRQLFDGVPALDLGQLQECGSDGLKGEEMRELHVRLCRISECAPVVCCIDDLHHVDAASQQFLQYVARHHNRSTRILLVVTQTLHYSPFDAGFSTELLRRPSMSRLQPQPLTATEVVNALSRFPGLTGRDGMAADLHRISGGNPLLLRALISEHTGVRTAASTGSGDVRPQPGGAFARAVVSCLQSCGQNVLTLAAAIIVLEDLATTQLLARLIGTTRTAVAQGMSALESSGLLSGEGLRHSVVRTTVLDHLPPGTLAQLHRRAADILHAQGAEAALVAQHLVSAVPEGTTPRFPEWAADVLRGAAEECVEHDEISRAVALLGLAHRSCADTQKRVAIKTRLAAIVWRLDPGTSEQHLTEAVRGARTAQVSVSGLLPLLHLLVAQGRMAEAAEVRGLISSRPEDGEADTSERVYLAAMDPDGAPTNGDPDFLVPSPLSPQPSGAFPGRRPGKDSPFSAVGANSTDITRFLRATKLTGATVPPIVQAIMALTTSEDLERGVHWCRVFRNESLRFDAPGWQALFSALRAQGLLRLGDLAGAEEHALESLECVADQRTSDFSYSALSTLLRARTEMGKYAEAAAIVEQPVPDTLHLTVHGLAYFRARAQYYMATRQFQAALIDLFQVGRLMKKWGIDRPLVLPWRTDVAEVLLQLGQVARAEQLVHRQLSMVDSRHPWVRGTSLRLRAATSDPKRRPHLLDEAISELRRSGDRVALARALADLGDALTALGDPLARTIRQEALSLAAECKAAVLHERILHGGPPVANPGATVSELPQDRRERETGAALSDSERRVASLAALKYTNREISGILHITVSTVEQHLTRVYRKLNITRRQDLPARLDLHPLEASEAL
ncbi:LuxR family transcriptional regulator [Streptomyces sulfonofaciens]|uniref:LuxR family transcriptional regulator n=1 Tax=Streptomyces sulfonofaciens TaxID=68272 RepID=A0A919L4U4_9ACTN|nr:LuxR family transcriptional regulator [Streptomyces sulfonofaciens]GHH84865.1 LuxR family transcriptional regulator [Streptomyces sulfonofaciens]